MDDLTVTTTTNVQTRWVLTALEDSVFWSRMKFNAKKSRCLVMRKGCVDRRVKMHIQEEEIPSIVIKCWKGWFGDKESIEAMKRK